MKLGWFETSLPVRDIRKSLAFYEALGFERTDGDAEIRNATVQRGDCRIGLFQGYLDPDRTQLIFWQGEVEVVCRDLEAKGVAFHVPLRKAEDGGASAMLIDPDGNPVYLITMPVFHVNDPGHARPAEHRPKEPATRDMGLGWFEISLPVQDIERAVAFYEMLGFKVVSRGDKGASATLQADDCRLALFQGVLDPAEMQMIFWQGDVPAIAADLAAKGLSLEGELRMGEGGLGALLRDPDGHALYFVNMPGEVRTEPA